MLKEKEIKYNTRLLLQLIIITSIVIYFFLNRTEIQFVPEFRDFITLFLSIIIEAFPFVVLGVLISIIVALFFKSERFLKVVAKNKYIANLQLSFLGVLMPVCECGNVPVARRLLMKNFNVPQTITFLLAAPIVNPITIYSTAAAFNYEPMVVVIRVLGALFIANVMGAIFYWFKDEDSLLESDFRIYCEKHEHEHNHKHGLHSMLSEGGGIFREEFIQVMKMLAIGAAIAALTQTFIPRDVITSIGSHGIASIIAMMILAFVISICSNVDAFFALSYSNSFTLGSILSFLIFGPMVDMKMLSMLKTTFSYKTLVIMSFGVGILSFLIGLLSNILLF